MSDRMVGNEDVAAVEAANEALYAALEAGDLDAMTDVWVSGADADDVRGAVCVHPGWPLLSGRAAVLRSYALIMANTDYIQFFLTDVTVEIHGDVALVTCTENILSGGEAGEDGEPGPLLGGKVVATNLFRRTSEGWRLWSHHGSPVLTGGGEDEDGDGDE